MPSKDCFPVMEEDTPQAGMFLRFTPDGQQLAVETGANQLAVWPRRPTRAQIPLNSWPLSFRFVALVDGGGISSLAENEP